MAVLGAAIPAAAQTAFSPGVTGGSNLPPPPAPLPPPKLEVQVAPKFNGPPQNVQSPSLPPSFSDRISRCLDAGAAAGLGPNDRAAYSRGCANGG